MVMLDTHISYVKTKVGIIIIGDCNVTMKFNHLRNTWMIQLMAFNKNSVELGNNYMVMMEEIYQ